MKDFLLSIIKIILLRSNIICRFKVISVLKVNDKRINRNYKEIEIITNEIELKKPYGNYDWIYYGFEMKRLVGIKKEYINLFDPEWSEKLSEYNKSIFDFNNKFAKIDDGGNVVNINYYVDLSSLLPILSIPEFVSMILLGITGKNFKIENKYRKYSKYCGGYINDIDRK